MNEDHFKAIAKKTKKSKTVRWLKATASQVTSATESESFCFCINHSQRNQRIFGWWSIDRSDIIRFILVITDTCIYNSIEPIACIVAYL
ncbi:hypothetical protein ABKN59_011968 [Abortiporus biennis]